MTRQEHIAWCKERAIAEMDYYKDPSKGIVSMMSDLRKHPETNSEALISLCGMQLMMKPKMSRQEAVNFINGFN
jgi:hypothetical protein